MKTLQELRELGIKTMSLKSSTTRRFLNGNEVSEIKSDKNFLELFNLMNSKTEQIKNCLKNNKPFWFAGKEVNISSLSFLI